MFKEALITGESGFLGSIISDSLRRSNYQIKTFGRGSENNFQGDLAAKKPQFVIDQIFDTIIHAAGKAHSIPKTQDEKQAFYDVNFEGTKRLCEALVASNCIPKSFIFISSVAVYGIDFGELISENHLLNGESPYAKSKILAEECLQEWAKDNNVILSILRLPLVAGPNPPGNLGAMINGIQSGRYLSIGKASAKKSVVWAADIAKIIPVLALTGGIYNLTDGYHPSFEELEKSIADATGKKPPLKIPLTIAKLIAIIGDFVGEKFPINSDKLKKITSDLTFDDSKARKTLGWQSNSVIQKLPDVL
jgi:nucleoside-diphosphate-sugar epimerase